MQGHSSKSITAPITACFHLGVTPGLVFALRSLPWPVLLRTLLVQRFSAELWAHAGSDSCHSCWSYLPIFLWSPLVAP